MLLGSLLSHGEFLAANNVEELGRAEGGYQLPLTLDTRGELELVLEHPTDRHHPARETRHHQTSLIVAI